MKITVKRTDKDFRMEAQNESGNVVVMDGSKQIGGHESGARPMQMLLMALGGCSSIDIISILRKQQIELDSLEVEINGEREEGAVPSLFRDIHVVFKIGSNADRNKVHRAAALSMEKYCSVSKTLESTAQITWEIEYI